MLVIAPCYKATPQASPETLYLYRVVVVSGSTRWLMLRQVFVESTTQELLESSYTC